MEIFFRYLNELEEKEIQNSPSKKQLLRFAIFMTVALFFLICFTYSVFSFVTLFFLVFWILIYIRFLKVWAAFGYSKLLIHIAVLAVVVSAFLLGDTVRQAIANSINIIIYG